MPPLPLSNTLGNPARHCDSAAGDPSWQQQLAAAIRDPRHLAERLALTEAVFPLQDQLVGEDFPLLVPASFVARMEQGNPDDPLLRQVLPLANEQAEVAGFTADPVGDQQARRSPGLLHKYHGRALLIATGACAVHCRYCFRREYPYQDEPRSMEDWEPALRELEADPSIKEIILSGGDPLILSDQRLERLCERIDAIEHIERIRFHSRLPIVLPARVTPELLNVMANRRCQAVMIVHANHGNEIAADCATALRRLVGAGVPVLNQAVLLRGVNDSVPALEALCRRLVNLGVMPYYLHQLDRVRGAAHFEVPETTGLRLVSELARILPGYAVPRYVRESEGEAGKTPIVSIQ